jgi:hypothetical protein
LQTYEEKYAEREAFRKEVKRILIAVNGRVCDAAEILGMRPEQLSKLLNHRGLVEWWVPWRKRLSLERYHARNRRSQDRYRRRKLLEQGIDPDLNYKPRKPRYV